MTNYISVKKSYWISISLFAAVVLFFYLNRRNAPLEETIVFNEKLQQFIAFFSDLTDKVKALTDDELASQNTHSTAREQLTDRNCNSKN